MTIKLLNTLKLCKTASTQKYKFSPAAYWQRKKYFSISSDEYKNVAIVEMLIHICSNWDTWLRNILIFKFTSFLKKSSEPKAYDQLPKNNKVDCKYHWQL